MSVVARFEGLPARVTDRLPARVIANPLASAVLAMTLVGLTLRLAALGARTPHYDEARVAFWALYLADTGHYAYSYITHGPFLHVVGSWVFGIVGATDFTMRLPVALVGGLLPLSALLFRRYLPATAVVGLAGLLALDPTLLYFSRFFRNDVLTAAFSFVALGFLLRAIGRRSVRSLYAAAALLGLSFATKENAILYLACWLGAGVLVLGHDLFRPRSSDSIRDRLGLRWRGLRAWLPGERSRLRAALVRWGGHGVGAVVLFLAIVVFFYAPRGSAASTVGFWEALVSPTQLPAMVGETVFDVLPRGVEEWTSRSSDGGSLFTDFEGPLGEMSRTLALGSGTVLALGVGGFLYALYDWVVESRLHPLALAGFYWAAASYVGYPLVASVGKPSWLVVHVVVPLALPAALGVAVVIRWGREAFDARQTLSLVLVGLLLGLVVGGALLVGADTSFGNAQADDNVMVQYAQPGDDMGQVVTDLRRVTGMDSSGPDVVFLNTESAPERYSLIGSPGDIVSDNWLPVCTVPKTQLKLRTLPMPWYFAAEDATVLCTRNASEVGGRLNDSPPPMVVTHARDSGVNRVEPALNETYERRSYDMFVYENEIEVWLRSDLAS